MNIITRIKYSPINVQVVVTRRCNLACRYCNEYDHRSPPVPQKDLIKYFEKLGQLGTLSITFSGGEPLLHPDIVNLVREAKRRIPIVSIITNAYLLTPELIQKFNEAKLSSVQISIDGVNSNRVTVKVLKFIQPKLELLRQYAKFQVNINSVIGPIDPQEATEVIKCAQRLGFSSTVGLLHDSGGQLKLNDKQLKIFYQLEKNRKKPFWDLSGFEMEFIKNGSSKFKCGSGLRYLYFDEFGKVRFCSQRLALYEKDLLKYSLKDLKENFYKYKVCCQSCTIGCVRRSSWLDSWRAQDRQ